MTAWADFEFYIEKHLMGKAAKIKFADFPYYAVRATACVKRYTLENISDTEVPESAKHAVCAVADMLCEYDSTSPGAGVTSEKVGDLSKTYSSETERRQALNTAIRDIVYTYLASSGYLYRGVAPC